MPTSVHEVFVTGGAGYVGAVLVPKLLEAGHRVKVLDLFIYGEDVLQAHPNLVTIKGDLRDQELLKKEIPGCDAVIHLACISNDPSFELDPELGRSINYDAFEPLVQISGSHGVRRFIYASSSSVYGIKEDENVTEDLPLDPLTDYSKYKALCEDVLLRHQSPDFTTVIVRPATVCGYSPRLRLDLTVNILTNLAVNNGRITVFGGDQKRPNIHIEDITDLYIDLLSRPDEQIAGRIWNAGYENHRVREIAETVRDVVGEDAVEIVTTSTDDLRSYHVSSEKIRNDLGFVPEHTIEDAVQDLVEAFAAGKIPGPLTAARYYNIKRMQQVDLPCRTKTDDASRRELGSMESMARRIRGKLVEMSHQAGTPHLGSSLSCVDILVAAYWGALKIAPEAASAPERDRFILSKGHAATALYAALAFKGFFPEEVLDTFAAEGSCLAEHPGPWCVPGVEAATGSLGHGLSLGIGMALAGRIRKESFRVYALLSDGECNEGAVWEAAMFAPARELENLVAIVDFNRWQATGRSEEVMALQPLKDKWRAFGWSACEVDGHDVGALVECLRNVPDGTGRPVAIVAHTVKGKGVSFMEDDNNWHYRIPTREEVDAAHTELRLP